MQIRNFTRRFSNWTYHTVYVDDTKTKRKRVLDWKGKQYDVLLNENREPYFVANDVMYKIKL